LNFFRAQVNCQSIKFIFVNTSYYTLNDTTYIEEGAAPPNLTTRLTLGVFVFSDSVAIGSAPGSVSVVHQCAWYQQAVGLLVLWLRLAGDEYGGGILPSSSWAGMVLDVLVSLTLVRHYHWSIIVLGRCCWLHPSSLLLVVHCCCWSPTCTPTWANPYPLPWVGVSAGQGKGFQKTWGVTNSCAGRPPKQTNRPHNGNAGVN